MRVTVTRPDNHIVIRRESEGRVMIVRQAKEAIVRTQARGLAGRPGDTGQSGQPGPPGPPGQAATDDGFF